MKPEDGFDTDTEAGAWWWPALGLFVIGAIFFAYWLGTRA